MLFLCFLLYFLIILLLLLLAENTHYMWFLNQPPTVINMFSLLYVTNRDY